MKTIMMKRVMMILMSVLLIGTASAQLSNTYKYVINANGGITTSFIKPVVAANTIGANVSFTGSIFQGSGNVISDSSFLYNTIMQSWGDTIRHGSWVQHSSLYGYANTFDGLGARHSVDPLVNYHANMYSSALYGNYNKLSGEGRLYYAAMFAGYDTLEDRARLDYSSTFGQGNKLTDYAAISAGSLYGYSNKLSGSSKITSSAVYGDGNKFSKSGELDHSLLVGSGNIIKDGSVYSSIYGSGNTLYESSETFTSVLNGYGNQVYGNLKYNNIVGGFNTLRGNVQNYVNIYGHGNTVTGSDSTVFIVGNNNMIGRFKGVEQFAGLTYSMTGDQTTNFTNGQSYVFDALSGGTNDTVFKVTRTIDNLTNPFYGDNTSFTINTAMDDRPYGNILSQPLHDVVVFASKKTVNESHVFDIGEKKLVTTGSIEIGGSDTTATAVLGKIVYKTSDNHFYGCVALTGKKWKQLDN